MPTQEAITKPCDTWVICTQSDASWSTFLNNAIHASPSFSSWRKTYGFIRQCTLDGNGKEALVQTLRELHQQSKGHAKVFICAYSNHRLNVSDAIELAHDTPSMGTWVESELKVAFLEECPRDGEDWTSLSMIASLNQPDLRHQADWLLQPRKAHQPRAIQPLTCSMLTLGMSMAAHVQAVQELNQLFASWVEEVKADIGSEADIDEAYDIEPIPLNILEEVQSKLASVAKLAAAATKDVMDGVAETLRNIAIGSMHNPDLTGGAPVLKADSKGQGTNLSVSVRIPLSNAVDDDDDVLDTLTCNVHLKSASAYAPVQITLKFSIFAGVHERMLTDEELEGLKHLSNTALAASSSTGHQVSLPLSGLVGDPSGRAAVLKVDEDDPASDQPSALSYEQAKLLRDVLEAAKKGKHLSAKLTLD